MPKNLFLKIIMSPIYSRIIFMCIIYILFKDLKNGLLTPMTIIIIIIIICCNYSSGGSSSSSSSRSGSSSINDNKFEHLFLIAVHMAISKEMYVNIT